MSRPVDSNALPSPVRSQSWKVPEGIEGFLLDLDGTLYLGDRLIPGADRFLDRLLETGRKRLFLTNNSSRSSRDWADKLRGMGVSAGEDEVFGSGEATARFLLHHHPGARVFLLGTTALCEELRRHGVNCVDRDPDTVLVGFDTTLTYDRLTRTCRLLLDRLPYLATHPDRVCPTPEGPIPDVGSFIALIRETTGREPDRIIGKPNRPMVDGALERLGLTADRVAMIGDRLYTDIAMARRGGLEAVLVLSGETDLNMVSQAPEEERPDRIVDSVASISFA